MESVSEGPPSWGEGGEGGRGGGTWPLFGYRGTAKALKSWNCLGQKINTLHYPVKGDTVLYNDYFKILSRTRYRGHEVPGMKSCVQTQTGGIMVFYKT